MLIIFFIQAVDVSRPEYEPSNTDILYADGIASSSGLLAYTDFLLPNSHHSSASIDNDSQLEIVPRFAQIKLHKCLFGLLEVPGYLIYEIEGLIHHAFVNINQRLKIRVHYACLGRHLCT